MQGSGAFEVCEGGALVANGRISVPDQPVLQTPHFQCDDAAPMTIRLSGEDVYKELKLRGYEYGPTFQGIVDSSLEGAFCHYIFTQFRTKIKILILPVSLLVLCFKGAKNTLEFQGTRVTCCGTTTGFPSWTRCCRSRCCATPGSGFPRASRVCASIPRNTLTRFCKLQSHLVKTVSRVIVRLFLVTNVAVAN